MKKIILIIAILCASCADEDSIDTFDPFEGFNVIDCSPDAYNYYHIDEITLTTPDDMQRVLKVKSDRECYHQTGDESIIEVSYGDFSGFFGSGSLDTTVYDIPPNTEVTFRRHGNCGFFLECRN